ncbi:LEAF RUST 10 DISEASE-RESISTANCE LOCUS RECEPTOR-LIKE PROTEIN KINASE-like 2.1 isoform X4 [Salvia divinorum]|uniref:LEAF RUST 10 DISEASE-RESISTANCE LOCUS RECEPTOR-LIKE PROTEIN KINASE-like 2.1 isoform X4 n=1 Tax=Salvia divinorum TaxID=28513 RepID=A0ABD1FJI8_SALDI
MIIATHNFIFLASSSLLLISLYSADAKKCSPSSCGAIRDISHPFRLNTDPSHCGHPEFELTCSNNVAFLYLDSIKYYVKHINYSSSTIRLADASVNNDDICSFPARSSNPSTIPDYYISHSAEGLVNLISCPSPLNNSTRFKDITACNLSHPRFSYVSVGRVMASEVPHMCRLDREAMISGRGLMDLKIVSLPEIHQYLLYGLELNFCNNCNEKSTIWGKKPNIV